MTTSFLHCTGSSTTQASFTARAPPPHADNAGCKIWWRAARVASARIWWRAAVGDGRFVLSALLLTPFTVAGNGEDALPPPVQSTLL